MNKDKGFSLIGILIVVAVFVLVGVVAWRVYETNQTGHTRSTDSNGTSNMPVTPNEGEKKTYLTIPELEIKIELDEKTKDTTYIATEDPNDEGVFIINPAMKSVDEENQYCSGNMAGMIGLLDRSTDINYWGKPLVVDNIKSFKIGEYYYVFRGPQSECSQDESISTQRADHIQDFIDVLKTIKADS